MIIALAIAGAILAGLGATTQHLSARAEREWPPRGTFVDAGGARQHVIDMGPRDAPAVVMIHGAYGSAEEFAVSLMPATSDRFRSIAIDRPGHGYSERGTDGPPTPDLQARRLHAALQALDVKKPILLGFSYGGAVALSYALQFPDEVGALLLVNTASHPWPIPVDLSYRIDGLPLLGPLLRYTVVTPVGHMVVDDGIAGVFSPAPVPPEYDKVPVSLSLRPATYAANAEDIRLLKPFLAEQSQRYPELRVPLVILVSDEDTAASPVIHSRPLAAQVPGAELIEVTGGGHPLHFSRRADVLAALERAVSRAGVSR